MQIKQIAILTAIAGALTACGGDITIDSSNNSGSNGGGVDPIPSNNCASYVDGDNITRAGEENSSGDCLYSTAFVDFDNPILEDITLSNDIDGAHIFAGSVFVGQHYSTIAEANAAGLFEGGDGPTLTIEEGVTVALQNSEDFIAIMRGSQIEAIGSENAPITFTSEADLDGEVTPEEVQSWGGMVINGFGFTNACDYEAGWDPEDAGTTLTLATGASCTILMEGAEGDRENGYGGEVPDDDSGTLSYVVVKHAGFEVVEGNELNGITFGAVGSETTLNNIEIYSNFDDGIEFFGGGADLTNYVALYVRDDSIDLDEGYYGSITNALVIQGGGTDAEVGSKTGAHCVESDGSASSLKAQNIANDYVTKAVISNLTCIVSAKGPSVAENSDPGAGINAEEGHQLTLNSSIVTTAYASDSTVDGAGVDIDAANLPYTNYCFQLEDTEDLENAGNGLININTTVFACADLSANKDRNADITLVAGTEYNAISGLDFLNAQDNETFATADDGTTRPDGDGLAGNISILNGFYSIPVAMMMIDGNAVDFDDAAITDIGAVSEAADWTAGWTYGLHDGSRGQALWFEE